MSFLKPIFTNGEVYHVYNRGVEKRIVFMEAADYEEMVYDLYDMNDERPWNGEDRYQRRKTPRNPKEPIVEVLAFALMPNHYHFLLRQTAEKGVVSFMQKLGTGYAMYFNKKNERVGPLFQGPFKAKHVDNNLYLQNVIGYIHTNPIDLTLNANQTNQKIIHDLKSYHWSSFPDYIGMKNFPAVTSREFVLNVMGGKKGIENSADAWLAYRKENRRIVSEIFKASP